MKRIVQVILLMTLSISVFSQIKFSAQAPNVVEIGEKFRLILSINGDGESFKAPVLSDFQILSGPNPSSSSSITIVNGQMQQSTSLSYTYILQPTKEGKFTIPAAKIEVDGKTYTSNTVAIEVIKGSGSSAKNNSGSGSTQQQSQQSSTDEAVSADDLFIKINFSKSNPYVGEPVVATFKFYSRISIYNISDAKLPQYSGFYSKLLNENQRIETKVENVNGVKYTTGVVQSVLLIPQKSGELTIDPASIEFVLIKQVRPTHFFDDGRRTFTKNIKSNATKIKVKPLPANKPSDFEGAVGKFSLSVKANKTKVKTNEAITITAVISGNGNLKLVNEPKLSFPPDFEVYDPKISENLDYTANGISGSKTFEYLVIPRYVGEFKIPAVSLSYFDLNSGSYKTLKSDEITFTVEKGEGGETVNIVQGYNKTDIQYLGKDIKFIKTNIQELNKPAYLIGTIPYFLFIGIPFLILLSIIILQFKKIKESKNIAKLRNKKANKVSLKRLKQAKVFLIQKKDAAFYEELINALWGYMSDKLTIPFSALTKDSIAEKLRAKNIAEADIEMFINILNQCEFARYAPSVQKDAKEQLFDNAKDIIHLFEDKLH
ncbi:MAG: protein BatD [Bacteroidales bacterium]|nr:protein BatD [Bacteroidales bacterium]